jgi:hypothetical protein
LALLPQRTRIDFPGNGQVLPGHAHALEHAGVPFVGEQPAGDEIGKRREASLDEGACGDRQNDVARLTHRSRDILDDYRRPAKQRGIRLTLARLVRADGDYAAIGPDRPAIEAPGNEACAEAAFTMSSEPPA